MAAAKKGGISILLGLGKPGPGKDKETPTDNAQALLDAGDNLIKAINNGDGAAAAQAVLDIQDLG